MTLEFVLSSHTKEEKKASSDLINECFDYSTGIKYHEEYDWLFLKNPGGIGQILIAYDGDKPVGQVGTSVGRFRFMDKDFSITKAEWVCILPKYRRLGIISKMIQQMVYNSNDSTMISFPNRYSMGGFLRSNYHPMSIKLLIRPLKVSRCFTHKKIPQLILAPFDGIWKSRKKIANSESIVEEYSLPKFDHRFDELFERMTNKTLIMQVRNSEFLNWRYKEIQSRNYKIIISTQDGRINGYIIVRLSIAYNIRVGFIMDMLAPNSGDEKNLIRKALKYFWENNAALAASICFPARRDFDLLKSEGFFNCPEWIRPYPYILYVRTPAIENHFDTNMILDSKRWLYMFGDFMLH